MCQITLLFTYNTLKKTVYYNGERENIISYDGKKNLIVILLHFILQFEMTSLSLSYMLDKS